MNELLKAKANNPFQIKSTVHHHGPSSNDNIFVHLPQIRKLGRSQFYGDLQPSSNFLWGLSCCALGYIWNLTLTYLFRPCSFVLKV